MVNLTKVILVCFELLISLSLVIQGFRIIKGKAFISPTSQLGFWLVKIIYGPDEAAKRESSTSAAKQKTQGIRAIAMGLILLIVALLTMLQHL